MPRVIHFEIPADDPERAVKFFQDVFGWTITKWEGPVEYWLIATGPDDLPGINGAVMRREGSGGTINTIDVPDVDAYMAKVKQAGGRVVTPRMAVPGVGWFCYCADTEGNMFGIMQEDPNAK
ncbi:MAG: VOC family protein [Candidatus Zixiibacteriota bacterium]|nr:MAG: VOC family protein [candidate division Zixibacteria bacterium]